MVSAKHHFPRGQGIDWYIEGAHDAPGASTAATPGVENALLPVAPAINLPAGPVGGTTPMRLR